MKDLLTIQEFSKLSGVESSTLRYWDDIGLFSPSMRNPDNNYRYYSHVQMLALNFVTTLSELQIPLKTIAELRKNRDPEEFLQHLEKLEGEMDMEMQRLRLRYSIVHARQELIRFGMRVDESAIVVTKMDEQAIIIWPPNVYNEGDTFLEPLTAFVSRAKEYHINLSFPVGGIHNDIKSFLRDPSKPHHFFSIDPIGLHVRKAGDYLVGYARGYYGELGDLPQRMIAYAKDHSLTLYPPVYLTYLNEEISSHDPTQYLAQCSIAVPKRKRK